MQQSPKNTAVFWHNDSHKSAAISHSDIDISGISVFPRYFVKFSMKSVSSEKITDGEVGLFRLIMWESVVPSRPELSWLDVRNLHPFIRPVKVKSQGSLGQVKEDLPKLHSHMSGKLCSFSSLPRERECNAHARTHAHTHTLNTRAQEQVLCMYCWRFCRSSSKCKVVTRHQVGYCQHSSLRRMKGGRQCKRF